MLWKDVGRKMYDEYKNRLDEIETSGKKVLSPTDSSTIFSMYLALMDNPKTKALINGAVYEQSYFWEDPHSGFLVKARPDILHENMIVDLKTCADASPRGFQNAMVAGGYHIQGAMIRDARRALEGIDCPNVINIAIEKKYPFSIGIYLIDEAALDEGAMQYKQALLDMRECHEKNEYPDYGVHTIGLPAWAYR
jgi:exodeoxyribonuclease VIII